MMTAPFIAMKEPTETSALVMGMRCTAAWMTILTVASPTGCAARTILQATGALGKSANADGCGAPCRAATALPCAVTCKRCHARRRALFRLTGDRACPEKWPRPPVVILIQVTACAPQLAIDMCQKRRRAQTAACAAARRDLRPGRCRAFRRVHNTAHAFGEPRRCHARLRGDGAVGRAAAMPRGISPRRRRHAVWGQRFAENGIQCPLFSAKSCP